MFYIFIIPSSIILLITVFEIIRIRKHDRILFSYCQLRRNILKLLREEGTKMSDEDYKITDELLEFVGKTIHEFKYIKMEIFNIRKLKKLLKKSSEVSGVNPKCLQPSENKEIQKLQEQYKFCVINSVLAYTPFLRSEIILRILILISEVLIKMSISKGKSMFKYVQIYKSEYEWASKPEHQYNVFANYQ